MRDCDKCKKRETCDDIKQDLTDKTRTLFGCSEFEPMVPFVKIRNLAKWMDENKMRAVFSDYESPIKVIMGEMETKLENDIVTAVQRYGIEVDKDELIKALQYDREQYEAGYRNGHIDGVLQAEKIYARPQGEWLPFEYDYDLPEDENGEHIRIIKEAEKTHWEEYWGPEFICSNCHAKNHKTNFCPYCGAKMVGGDEND